MSDTTKIQWTDHTFNGWEGCTKISPGCQFCYAEARNNRFGGGNWGKGKSRRRTSVANWKKPLKWDRDSADGVDEGVLLDKDIRRQRVFCASLADWLDDEVPIEWLADLLKLIHDTPNLDWQLLTKRPENFFPRLREIALKRNAANTGMEHGHISQWVNAWIQGQSPHNVWIGTSIEDQPRDYRIAHLLKIPAKVRFLSVEPLLGPIKLRNSLPAAAYIRMIRDGWDGDEQLPIDWVIVGGESGPKARPCNIDWIRSIVEQCKAASVPVFVKQLGAVPIEEAFPEAVTAHEEKRWMADGWTRMVGFKGPNIVHWQRLLRLKDPKGGDMEEWPNDLRIREFPYD